MSAVERLSRATVDNERGSVLVKRGAVWRAGKLVLNAQQMKSRLDGRIAYHGMKARISIIHVTVRGEDMEVGVNAMSANPGRLLTIVARWCEEIVRNVEEDLPDQGKGATEGVESHRHPTTPREKK